MVNYSKPEHFFDHFSNGIRKLDHLRPYLLSTIRNQDTFGFWIPTSIALVNISPVSTVLPEQNCWWWGADIWVGSLNLWQVWRRFDHPPENKIKALLKWRHIKLKNLWRHLLGSYTPVSLPCTLFTPSNIKVSLNYPTLTSVKLLNIKVVRPLNINVVTPINIWHDRLSNLSFLT